MPDTGDSGYVFALSQLSQAVTTLSNQVAEGFSDMRARLDSKLDKADGARIELRIEHIEQDNATVHQELFSRMKEVEAALMHEAGRQQASKEASERTFTTKQKWAAGIATVVVAGATIAAPLLAIFVGGH